jgi:uncharacterized protein
MIKKIVTATIVCFFIGTISASAYYSPGSPSGFVNDFAEMMSSQARQQLEQKLSQFEKDTSNEISVVTINSLQSDTIENFAVKLFEEWGIGKKDKDNGVLLLIAKADRQMRIEVGYGLEGALTDAQSYWIIQNMMRPAFQAGNYDQGISDAVDKIIAATKGEYVPSQNQSTSSKTGWNFKSIETIIFLAFFAFVWLAAVLARSKSWWAGGIVGAVIGIVLIFVIGWLLGLIALIILTPLGLLFDYAVSKTYQKHKSAGTRFPWWIGGFGRGGGRGGGFGGFGGGSSGGGGASGSW